LPVSNADISNNIKGLSCYLGLRPKNGTSGRT
jgi:hypothetical protein